MPFNLHRAPDPAQQTSFSGTSPGVFNFNSVVTSGLRRFALLALVVLPLTSLAPQPVARAAEAQVDPAFRAYFDAHGGVPILGLPLGDALLEGGRKVQYTERARMEQHLENAGTPYEVQLGLLGIEMTAGRLFEPVANSPRLQSAGLTYFDATGHTLGGAFLDYWNKHGGLAQFGYPISEEIQENGYTVQYFERNRFEFHPENQPPYNVLLGLLGRDSFDRRVAVGEATVTLPAYDYQRGFRDGGTAGYPALDFAAVGPATPKTYKLITLENRFLKLSVMPELGGRLYDVVFKPTGHSELYRNPVIKPAPFGARGWWLGVGGSEWAIPTDEHGLIEYLPWTATIRREERGGATVVVNATERSTGLQATGEITLMPNEGNYDLKFTVKNASGSAQRFQMWTNTMLAPGGTNHVPANSRWTLPTSEFIVHSTDNATLPAPQQHISWPVYNGADLSDYSTWRGYLGGFVAPEKRSGDYAALYNTQADEGMVRVGPPANVAQGIKIFGFGPSFDPHTYTDDDSSYAELWGGLLPTFWDYTSIAPGAVAGWSESWQPVSHSGGVKYAADWGALNSTPTDGGVSIDLAAACPFAGRLIVRRNNAEIARANLELQPGVPFAQKVNGSGPVDVEITTVGGSRVLRTTLR